LKNLRKRKTTPSVLATNCYSYQNYLFHRISNASFPYALAIWRAPNYRFSGFFSPVRRTYAVNVPPRPKSILRLRPIPTAVAERFRVKGLVARPTTNNGSNSSGTAAKPNLVNTEIGLRQNSTSAAVCRRCSCIRTHDLIIVYT